MDIIAKRPTGKMQATKSLFHSIELLAASTCKSKSNGHERPQPEPDLHDNTWTTSVLDLRIKHREPKPSEQLMRSMPCSTTSQIFNYSPSTFPAYSQVPFNCISMLTPDIARYPHLITVGQMVAPLVLNKTLCERNDLHVTHQYKQFQQKPSKRQDELYSSHEHSKAKRSEFMELTTRDDCPESMNEERRLMKDCEDLVPSIYRTSTKGHVCVYCGKLYSRKYGLKIHLRTHTGYKPLKCKVCHRPFGDPSNLNKHIRLHAQGDTPYRCEFCGKVLVRRRDLDRHIKSRHPSQNDDVTDDVDDVDRSMDAECGPFEEVSSSTVVCEKSSLSDFPVHSNNSNCKFSRENAMTSYQDDVVPDTTDEIDIENE